MSNSKTSYDFLAKAIFTKFFLLFNANRIDIATCESGRIDGVIGWPDEGQPHYDENEERQEVRWIFSEDSVNPDISLALELIGRQVLLRGDRIQIPREDLEEKLAEVYAWNNTRTSSAIDNVLRISIDMIDDGEPTDRFFVHF